MIIFIMMKTHQTEYEPTEVLTEQQENIPTITSFLESICKMIVELKDQNLQYPAKMKSLQSKIYSFLYKYIKIALPQRGYRQFIQKATINLINYESFQERRDVSKYKYIQNHLKNSQYILRALEFKTYQDFENLDLQIDRKNKFDYQSNEDFSEDQRIQDMDKISANKFFELYKQSDLQYFKEAIKNYSHYSVDDLYNQQLGQHLYSQKICPTGQMNKKDDHNQSKNSFKAVLCFLKQNSKMKSFLTIKIIHMILLSSEQRQEMLKIIYFIVFIQSIQMILTPTSSLQSKKIQDTTILYSLFIGNHSNIRQFFPLKFNIQQNQIAYQQEKAIDVQKYIAHKLIEPQKQSFSLYFGLDLLNFVKDTFINGISLQISRKQIVILDGRMSYNFLKPIIITKKISQLQQINPSLANTLQSLKKHSSKLKLNFFQKIYNEENMIKNRIEQINKMHATLKQIFEGLKYFFPKKSAFSQNVLSQVFVNLFSKQIDVKEFERARKIETLIIQEIDNMITKWCEMFSIRPQQNLRTQYYHLYKNKNISHSKNIFQSLINNISSLQQQQYQSRSNMSKLQESQYQGSILSQESTKTSQEKTQKKQKKKFSKNFVCRCDKRYSSYVAWSTHYNNTHKKEDSKQQKDKLFKKMKQFNRQTKKEKNDSEVKDLAQYGKKYQAQKNQYAGNRQKGKEILKKQNFYQVFLEMAVKINNINKNSFTGINFVQAIYKNHFGIQIHEQFISPQETINFGEISPNKAKDLFYTILLPRKISLQKQDKFLTKNQISFRKRILTDQKKQFSQDDLQNVSKTLLQRITMAFENVSSLMKIKLQLFLLRHLMIDNRLNYQNYPNLIPRLNIMKCLIDTNLANKIKQPNFIQEYYLNQTIKKLDLSLNDHNKLIQAIFLLSLITQDNQANFLKKIQASLSRNSRNFELKNKIKDIFEDLNYEQSNQTLYFYQKITVQSQVVPVFKKQAIQCITSSLLGNPTTHYDISHFFHNSQQIKRLKLEDQKNINQKPSYGHVLFCYKLTGQLTYFIRKVYELQSPQSWNQYNQYEQKDEMLKLMYCNMEHIYNQYQSSETRNLFNGLQPIIYLKSFSQKQHTRHRHFQTLTQISPTFHITQLKSNHYNYLSDNQVQMDIIRNKCVYYQSLNPDNRKKFIRQLFKILINANRFSLQLLNLNIGTVQLAETENNSDQTLNQQGKQTKRLRPIVYDYSLSFYFGNNQPLKSININSLQMIYGSLQNHLSPVSYPYQNEFRHILQENTNFYSRGQIGLISCILEFRPKQLSQNNLYSQTSSNPSSYYRENVQPIVINYFLQVYRAQKQALVNNNFCPKSISTFSKKLYQFVQSLSLNIPQDFKDALLNSIHPKIQDRLQLQQILTIFS